MNSESWLPAQVIRDGDFWARVADKVNAGQRVQGTARGVDITGQRRHVAELARRHIASGQRRHVAELAWADSMA
eukprot:3776769-Rhodomonas_salina.1